MATQLEITLTNSVRQQADAYFRKNIGLYPTRNDVASVLPGQITANGEQLAFARNVINNMSPTDFCIRDLNNGTNLIDLCDAEIPEKLQVSVTTLFPGSVVMDDVMPGCMSIDARVSGYVSDFSVTCNGAAGLSGTLYYIQNGTIGDNYLPHQPRRSMTNEIKKTPRNKARAQQQFAAQIAELGITKEEFMLRANHDGILYLADPNAQICSQNYTSTDTPTTFAWLLSIIKSLTPIQINDSTPFTCPASLNLSTQDAEHVEETTVPSNSPNPSPEPTSNPQLPLDIPDERLILPTELQVEEPAPSNSPSEIITAPTWSPSLEPIIEELSSNETIPQTEAPVDFTLSVEPQDETESSPEENVSDSSMKDHNSHGSFYETMPFMAIVSAVVVGAIAIGGMCFWKKKMNMVIPKYHDGDAKRCAGLRAAVEGFMDGTYMRNKNVLEIEKPQNLDLNFMDSVYSPHPSDDEALDPLPGASADDNFQ